MVRLTSGPCLGFKGDSKWLPRGRRSEEDEREFPLISSEGVASGDLSFKPSVKLIYLLLSRPRRYHSITYTFTYQMSMTDWE
jgi:hypothetical protein